MSAHRGKQDADGRWLTRASGRRPLSALERRAIFERDRYCCKKCGYHNAKGEGLEVHHVVEVINGGSDEPDNLDTLCCSCHGDWTWCDHAIKYELWLHTPSARMLAAMFATPWPREAEEVRSALIDAFLLDRHNRIVTASRALDEAKARAAAEPKRPRRTRKR